MARGELIKQMLSSHQRGDEEAFREAASEVIADERRRHHGLLAQELQEIMHTPERAAGTPVAFSSLKPLPKAKDEANLVELVNPRRTLQGQILRPDVRDRLNEVLEERRRASVLHAHGLSPVRTLLFVGPPGTGKSSTAESLASELGVPLARVNLPAVVSSLLGETSRNLAAIFDSSRSEPWVLLFDEFDALGRERSDATEHGELKRVVTTFLQLLDHYAGPAVVIAATNHPAMLDDAVWRRFDDVIGFKLPTMRETEKLVRRLFRRVQLGAPPREVAQRLRRWPQADVELVCRAAMKRSVLRDGDSVSLADLDAAIKRLEERRATIRNSRG
ncbi:MAG: ATP-binding protein [Solirubrobacteraceae bacterium MAG38_C4-C5]|nr:ATP-binding protein [Candidatus Siliceabacter maunaloa]